MVKLSLHSTRSNQNSRCFPSLGYLALTPVKVDGVVRTRLQEDGKPLLVSKIAASVRCVESRLGRMGVSHSNVLVEYTQPLWSPPEGDEWGEVGDSEYPFKITVPVDTPGWSNANYQDYRVFWRVEAVMEHIPLFGVGTRQVRGYELPFVRYQSSIPRHLRPSHSPLLQTSHPRFPSIRYRLSPPSTATGPLDIVSLPLILHPSESSIIIRGASVLVERRIELQETSGLSPPLPKSTAVPPGTPGASEGHGSESTLRPYDHDGIVSTASSTHDLTEHPDPSGAAVSTSSIANSSFTGLNSTLSELPLMRPVLTNIPAKIVTYNVTGMNTSGSFAKDSAGVYSKTLTFQWPTPKSHGHWALGETMETDLAKIRFFVIVKVIVSSPSHGTESLDLQEREIFVMSTNDSDRKVASTKYDELRLRSKSKSPRRSKLDPLPSPPQSPTIPIPSRLGSAHSDHRPHHHQPQSALPINASKERPKSSSSKMKRPHTSAGPRDRTHSRPFDMTNLPPRIPNQNDQDHDDSRPDHHRTGSRDTLSPPSPTWRRDRPETAQPLRTPTAPIPLPAPSSPTKPAPLTNGRFVSDPDTVHAWEEELRRIELQSRQSSADMLSVKRKRIPVPSSRPGTNGTMRSSTSDSSNGSL